MAALNEIIDASWDGQELTFRAYSESQLIGTASATLVTDGVILRASANLNFDVEPGQVEVILADAGGSIAWRERRYVDSDGEFVDPVSALRTDVFSKLSSESATEGKRRDVRLAKDYSEPIAVQTDADSTLVWSLRRCLRSSRPTIEIDSVAGLTIGSDGPADGGSVVRESGVEVAIFMKADAFDHLSPGKYFSELTELFADGRVESRYIRELFLIRSAGRRMV